MNRFSKTRRTSVLAALIGAFVLLMPMAAHAENNGTNLGPKQRLHVDGYCLVPPDYSVATPAEPPIVAGWVSGSDSPTDAQNNKALSIQIPAATADCYYYVEAFTDKSTTLPNVPVNQIRNLSFEFHNTEAFGGGAPRFSIQTSDGDVMYADAAGCNNPLAVSPTWSRADFTGRTATGCTITGSLGTYSSDGVNSAWGNFAAANPTETISLIYMVFDAGTASTYRLDRIAIPNGAGTAKMFNNSDTKAFNCTTEASC